MPRNTAVTSPSPNYRPVLALDSVVGVTWTSRSCRRLYSLHEAGGVDISQLAWDRFRAAAGSESGPSQGEAWISSGRCLSSSR